jgi:hypothetical protein
MKKEIEENGERWCVCEVGGSYGVVVWKWWVDRWIYQRGGFDSVEEAEAFCRRGNFSFSVA